MDRTVLVTAEHLTKQYGKGETAVRALDDISLQVYRGEFVAVTGESGSGKTTLLNMLGALDTPTEGSIEVNGVDLRNSHDNQLSMYRRRNIGFIFQFYNLIPVLNTEENVVLPLSLDNKTADMAYLSELLEMLGLADRRYHFPHQLSGGQQQRVSIVRALITKPVLILADEPTGNLDSKNSREVVSMLKASIRKYNQTLILITHDGRVAAHADRVIRMEDGRIVSDEVQ